MSRHFRSICAVAQSAAAGPSRHSLPLAASRPLLQSPTHLSRRTLFEDIPFLRRFQQKERDETAQEVAEKKAAAEAKTINENGTAATGTSEDQGEGIFGGIGEAAAREATRAKTAKVFKEHSYTSARHKISYKKLKLLTHQLKGLPIDEAILQMQFSVKGAASWIRPNLLIARDHAVLYKNMKKERLMVSEAFVNKEPYGPKQLDIKARGKHGIKRHPYCRLKIVLREGKTMEERVAIRFTKDVNKHARSAMRTREDQTIRRKTNSTWAW